MSLLIHFGSQSADWNATIVSDLGKQADGWHRYGVRFSNLTTADIDLLNDSIFSIVVPQLFTMLSQPGVVRRIFRSARRRLTKAGVRSDRHVVRVPMRVGFPGGSFVGSARDLSATGVSLVAPRPVAIGSRVELSIVWPNQLWSGPADVARCEHRQSRPGFDTWVIGLHFAGAAPTAVIDAQLDAA